MPGTFPAVLVALLVLGTAHAQNFKTGEWIAGRATFYGGRPELKAAYSMRPGAEADDSYGVIEFGSCGFTHSDGVLAYPQDMYAALADTNWDYGGSCGRCYEVRCKSGLVLDKGAPVKTTQFFDMGKANPNYIDSKGRRWPGNKGQAKNEQDVKCWDDKSSIVVRVGDSCPCQQKKPDGTVQPQFWCCGGANHMDLSYWAFEKLAHPTYGVIGVEYRPVDCYSKDPLAPVPGYVAPFIYDDDLGSGWGWMPYRSKNTIIRAAGEGRKGRTATCLTASKNGAVKFSVKRRTGLMSTGGRLDLWIKSNTKSRDPFASSTPPGQPPNLKIFLMNDDKTLYCGREVMLGGLTPASQDGAYFKFEIPLSLFQCGSGSSMGNLSNVNRIDIMNTNTRDADFCIDYLAAIPDGGATARSEAKPLAPAEAPAPAEEPVVAPRTPAAPPAEAPAPAEEPVVAPRTPAAPPAEAPAPAEEPVVAPRTPAAPAPRAAPAVVPVTVPAPPPAPATVPAPVVRQSRPSGFFPFFFPFFG